VIVQELEKQGYSLSSVLFPGAQTKRNDNLFKGQLRSIEKTLSADIERLPSRSPDLVAQETFKDGRGRQWKMSAGLINDRKSSFVLTGIVNRMDRGYRTLAPGQAQANCGEIRLLYRFTYDIVVETPGSGVKAVAVASRLPFTLAVVFHAKGPQQKISCSDIARRWQALDHKSTPAEIVSYLLSTAGPLRYLQEAQIDRIETNLQLFRLPASIKKDFGGHAEYLLRVFRRDAPDRPFVIAPLENQVDRAVLLEPKNAGVLAEFKTHLLRPASLKELDQGTFQVPFKFLATRAISVSPGGTARSQNQPTFGLFDDQEILKALQNYEKKTGTSLATIKSASGFRRRLDDLSCNGCHQTRAIAGFHFPGADPGDETPSNAVHVAGSAHFEADLPRRRAIIDAFAAKRQPDFSRPFNARPDKRFDAALAGTQLTNGWGALCHSGGDPSFADWTCGSGLACTALHASSREPGMGVYVTAGAVRIGDPVEFGEVLYDPKVVGNDSYVRRSPPGSTNQDNYHVPPAPADRSDYRVAHQGWKKDDSTGGFPAGMLRIGRCESLPADEPLPSEAKCGRVASTGFNSCISAGKPFSECLKKTETAGLRACDRSNPCRPDYICTAPYDLPGPAHMGTCIPPYFMFQFRVDGHSEAPVEHEPVSRSEAITLPVSTSPTALSAGHHPLSKDSTEPVSDIDPVPPEIPDEPTSRRSFIAQERALSPRTSCVKHLCCLGMGERVLHESSPSSRSNSSWSVFQLFDVRG
jgi:hypothetical protein